MPAVTILNSNLPAAVLEAFVSLDWTRPYWKSGQFTLRVSPAVTGVSEIAKGRILLPPDSNICYVIEDVLKEDAGVSGGEVLTVTGRDLGGFFAERIALPTAGLAYDTQTAIAAETAIKHLVNVNAGPGAAADRQIPSMTVAADVARGGLVSVQARYQYVSDLIEQIGMTGGIGWQVLYNGTGFVFDVIPGVDRHASVFFDALFDTAAAQSWYTSDSTTKTFAYVAGQGEGTARTIVTRYTGGSSPTGLALRETFIDARDLSDSGALATRGDGDLAATTVADRFEVVVNPLGSFKYRADWDLGDLVTIRNSAWGVAKTCRIVDVALSLSGDMTTPDVTISLDRAFPTLASAIAQSSVSPVSTADAVASALYAKLSGATFTGGVTISGAYSLPNAPSMSVTKGSSQTFAANTTVTHTFTNVNVNVGSGYASGTSTFTAPEAGWYLVSVNLSMNHNTTDNRQTVDVYVNGAAQVRLGDNVNVAAQTVTNVGGSSLIQLSASDAVTIRTTSFANASTNFYDGVNLFLCTWAMRKVG